MVDNTAKKSVRSVERLLVWLGWTVFTIALAGVFFTVFILPYLLLFLWNSVESVGAEITAVYMLIVQFLAMFYILYEVGVRLGHKLYLLHEWAHNVKGRE